MPGDLMMNVLVLHPSTCGGVKLVALLTVLSLVWPSVRGQPVGLAKGQGRQDASRWGETKKILARIQVNKVVDNQRVPLKLVEQPVLSFVNNMEKLDEGSVWVWGRAGRPSVLMQMWNDMPRKTWRYYSFTSLSTGFVEAHGAEDPIRWIRWTPREAGVQFNVFPNAPEPAAKQASRLRQMKELARRFKAHEMTGARFELRLLPRQVHRYSDSQSGLVDGAAFIWSRGTDPEILLLIELVQGDADVRQWQYAFARISNAELHVYLGGEEVWSRPTANVQPASTRGYALYAERLPRQP